MASGRSHPNEGALVTTGIDGLDDILGGGFTPNRLYLIEGDPGSGKTTLALQFLLEGARRGEPVLYVTLSETREELRAVGRSHGWSLDRLTFCELIPTEESLRPDAQYQMFHPSEVELNETTRAVLAEVDRTKPTRIVFDLLSELRLLAQNPLRYRRQILAFKQYFTGYHSTVLLLDDRTSEITDLQLQSICHGVVTLQQLSPEYGAERRRLRIVKMRGVRYRGGYHDFIIERGGLRVFPRLIAAEHHRPHAAERLESGVPALDALLGGGLDRGSSVLLLGPAGSGKSSLATQFAVAAAARGERTAIFTFDESIELLQQRSAALGLPLNEHVELGRISIQQVDPAALSPGEFAYRVRRSVEAETGNARVVVIDSLNGYLNAMPEERSLIIQLHELLTYLGQQGVVTLLIVAQHGMVGLMQTPVDASYLADAVLILRFFEAAGEVRQAISVMKKRRGSHERTIREFRLTDQGIQVGEPLRQFQGVLTGVPTLRGAMVAPGGTQGMTEQAVDRAKHAELQVLLMAPTARDAALSELILVEAGLTCTVCEDLQALCWELEAGAGAVVLPEGALDESEAVELVAALGQQPAWSDLPIIMLTHGGPNSARAARAVGTLGNVMFLELPVRVTTLVSTVRTALRARLRQYQIREHLADRERSEQALREADRRKDEFLAILAHELRNPVGAISNALQILRMSSPDRPAWQRAKDVMERQIRHQTRLVDDLLDVSRITQGKIQLRPLKLDLALLIRETVEDHRSGMEEHGLTLVLELPPAPVWVRGDPTRLAQILENLLENARKFTPAGGTVGVGCGVWGVGSAVLTVRDTGMGIEPAMLAHLFEPFAQADRTLHRSPGGLGLGLALVKGLVDLHGGTVSACSEGSGRGATFTITLPLATSDEPRAISEAGKPTSSHPVPSIPRDSSVRVLVIEDNPDAAQSLRDLLELSGCEVEVAGTGPAGVEMGREFRPHVVLCDIGLPGMDGYGVAAALRREPAAAAAYLVALSGYGQYEDQRRARDAGFDRHLTKPVDPDALRRLLEVERVPNPGEKLSEAYPRPT